MTPQEQELKALAEATERLEKLTAARLEDLTEEERATQELLRYLNEDYYA